MRTNKTLGLIVLLLSTAILSACSLNSDTAEQAVTDETDEVIGNAQDTAYLVLPEYLDSNELDGEVCSLYGINFKLDGDILNDSTADIGVVTYASNKDVITDITASRYVDTGNVTDAVRKMIKGDYAAIDEYLPYDIIGDSLTYYYYSVDGESYMDCVYSEEKDMYYSVVPCLPHYMIVSSSSMFFVTLEPAAITFDNPADNPMTYHTRSTYEETAVANTIRALSERSRSDSSTGDMSLFNTATDKEKRDKMISYGKLTWNLDGTNTLTNDVIDTKSISAKASQWTLKATSQYSYVENGLKLYGLYGTKSNTNFSIQGTVDNLFDSPRPWVIMIKYLDIDSQLLALKVLDYTDSPIPAGGTGTFSCSLSDSVDLNSIAAIQFEMY